MKYYSILFFLITYFSGFAQGKEAAEFFRQLGMDIDTIYFSVEPVGESRSKDIKKRVAKGYLTGMVTPIPMTAQKGHPLTLTAKEKQFLLYELDKDASAKPSEYLSHNKNYLPVVPVQNFDFKKYKCYSTFSKPIFFRNNSLCLIYTSGICGPLNGEGGWKVYRKEKGKWKQWIMVTQWMS